MERLTSRDESGYYHLRMTKRLGNNFASKKVLTQVVGKYEDAEESGLLLRLPCKVGDTVYAYCKELSKVLPYFIEQIIIDYDPDNKNGYWVFNADSSNNEELLDSIDFTLDEIGKTVFLTREEAEQALEGRDSKC